MSAGWQITGREEELAHASKVLAGGAGGLLVVGPAGAGKSRLVQELAEQAAADGHEVAVIAGSEAGAGLPLAAVAPLLPPHVVDAGIPVLVQLRRALDERAEGRPILLVVDDAHLLDDASALLVHQLTGAPDVRVVATKRISVLAPDPIVRLVQDRTVERLELGPLDRDATVALAEVIAGEALEPRAADRVWRLTGGNPLFVRELLLSLGDDRRPAGEQPASASSRLLDPGAAGSPRLVDLVRHRLADLDQAARDALVHVAFGEPLGPGELAGVVDADALDRLDRSGLLDSTLDGKRLVVRLAHPLYGEVLRADATPLQRRAIRYRLAEALQATGARRREDAVRLAAWAIDGGLDIEPSVLVEAAQIARFSNDNDLAERLARAAFEAEPGFVIGQVLADVLWAAGDSEALVAHLPRWEATATEPDQRAAVAMSKATGAFWRQADEAGAFAALEEATALAGTPAGDEALARKASLLAFAGHPQEALAVAEPLLDRGPDRVLIQAALAANQALRSLGRPLDGLEVIDRALAAYRVLGDQAMLVSSRILAVAHSGTLTDAGRFDEAETAVQLAVATARDAGQTDGMAMASGGVGLLDLPRGRTDSARQAFLVADHVFAATRQPGMARWTKSGLALADATRGDLAAAQAHLDALDALGPHPCRQLDHVVHRARAAVAWLDNRPADAQQLLIDGAAEHRAAGDVLGEVHVLHDLARLGRAEDAAPRLAELTASLGPAAGDAIPAMAAHASGLASRSVDELADAAGRFEAMGAWLWAAEAAFAAADAARTAGDQRAAARWTNAGDEHRSRCEAVRTAGLVTTDGPVPLTRREREVAILAAQGLPSREIGERLFVGRRTVESHLARIYGKLGIRSRAELARLLDGGREAIVA